MMRHIVGREGAAGGHGTMAGARLFAHMGTDGELQSTFLEMVRRLRETLGHETPSGEPLLRAQANGHD
jgi:hypothetical protein